MPKDTSAEAQKLKAEAAAAAEAAGKPKPGEEEAPKVEPDKKDVPNPADKPAGEDGKQKSDENAGKTPEQLEADKKAALAGLDSEIGAKKIQVENLRLEKRNLSGQQSPAPKKPAPAKKQEEGEEEEEDGEEEETPATQIPPAVDPTLAAAVEELQKDKIQRQQKLEKDVLTVFSKNKEFPLTNVERDANNQNWNRMIKYLPANYDRSSPEAIQDALEAAYHAAFRKEIQAELIEKGKQQGLAEAVHVQAADMGGIVPGNKAPAELNLSEAEKAQAKKMGVTPEQYAAQKKKMQES